MDFRWVDGFELSVTTAGSEVTIAGNRAGLLSLANHLRTLANEPQGAHLHLDEYNSLEHGSCELVIEKTD